MRQRTPSQQAVAVQWNPVTEELPTITASGEGALAAEILRMAAEHNIPIRQDNDLLQVLSLLDVGESIPAQAHTAIAEILAFIYWSNQQYADILESK